VYEAIVRRGEQGATREELALDLALRLSTICGRVAELAEQGFIYDTGTTRTGSSGRAAVVMRAKREV
jgi:predicted transcriptional regulator